MLSYPRIRRRYPLTDDLTPIRFKVHPCLHLKTQQFPAAADGWLPLHRPGLVKCLQQAGPAPAAEFPFQEQRHVGLAVVRLRRAEQPVGRGQQGPELAAAVEIFVGPGSSLW